MRNIFLIAKREYLERVRSRAFLIMTLFIPALMFGSIVLPALLMTRGGAETKHMVVVAADRDTAEAIRSQIEQQQDQSPKPENTLGKKRDLPQTHFSVEVSTNATAEERDALTKKVND